MTHPFQLLIAEDDQHMALLLAELAQAEGFDTRSVRNGRDAAEALTRGDADVLLTDLRLPPPDGLELLRLARRLNPELPVVMITGHASLQVAVDAFRSGLHDLITKPFENAQVAALLRRLGHLLAHRRRLETLAARLSNLEGQDREPVVASAAARQALSLMETVAPLDVPVLLTGETGTGKTSGARLIHRMGPRGSGPFFALSCAAIAHNLIESELFGHERGAFTGAATRKRGLLELADGGTLLLDEINSASPEVQVRLLQFIQERTLMRVGGVSTLRVDVRLVFATNEDLLALVQAGGFRKDLYFRINVFPIPLPPLRDRPEDIVPLAEQLLMRFARELECPAKGFSSAALEQLLAYPWPGNIRELENLVQRAVILCRGDRIEPGHLPLERVVAPFETSPNAPFPPDANLQEVERLWIAQTLERCQGNKSEAARRLGIDVSTLHRKLRADVRQVSIDRGFGAT